VFRDQLEAGGWKLVAELNEDKSVRYHRLKRRCAVASVAITAVLLAALLATGLSSSIADAARRARSRGRLAVLTACDRH
jgi:hypothetical protein